MTSSAETVHAWLAAVNAGDADAALALTSPDVTIIGPRGTARGHQVLRAWLAHAGATFATRAAFARGDAVVVAQHGVWRDETGAVVGEAGVATRFRVHDGNVAELERYDELADALRAADLSEADAVTEPEDGGTVDVTSASVVRMMDRTNDDGAAAPAMNLNGRAEG